MAVGPKKRCFRSSAISGHVYRPSTVPIAERQLVISGCPRSPDLGLRKRIGLRDDQAAVTSGNVLR